MLFMLEALSETEGMKVRLPTFKRRRPNHPNRGKNRDKLPVFLKLSNGDAVPVYPIPSGAAGGPGGNDAMNEEAPNLAPLQPEDFFSASLAAAGSDEEGAQEANVFGPPENIQAKFSSMMPEEFDEGAFAKSFGDTLPDFPDLASIFDDSASFSSRLDSDPKSAETSSNRGDYPSRRQDTADVQQRHMSNKNGVIYKGQHDRNERVADFPWMNSNVKPVSVKENMGLKHKPHM